MRTVIRQIAVSGSAAAALLGGAAAITMATPAPATAAEVEAAVDRAAGTPVTLPSGRTLHIRGLDTAGHPATPAQRSTVVTLAAASTDNPNPGTGTPLGPGVGPQPGYGTPPGTAQQPGYQQPGGYNPQQLQTQAGAGTISLTVAIGIALLVIVVAMVKRGGVRFVQAFLCVALGVYLAPTFFGPLLQQLGGSLGQSLGNVWSGLG